MTPTKINGLQEKMQKWANAHVFYNMFLHGIDDSRTAKISDNEKKWREWAVQETPNGKLILRNGFFDILKKSEKIFLFHVTPNLEKITESGVIYSSGGCLVGSVYAAPLFPEGDGFRVHNLGEYIFKSEASRASYLKENGRKPSILIIEVDLPERAHDNLIGIDYTKLGDIHLSIYKDLEYLLSFRERAVLQEVLVNNVRQCLPYLNVVSSEHKGRVDSETFFHSFLGAIDHLPILGYLYFEAVSEYLMLFQNFKKAKIAHGYGEFYNASYKDLMFDIFPELLKGVGLGFFKPTFKQVADYITSKKLISNFDRKAFEEHLIKRLIFLTKSRLLCDNCNMDWRSMNWDFKNLEAVSAPLLGHLVHRELRNFGRFPDFYFYFDQFKALQVWNYWNQMGITIPFNGFIPKGEIGVNPAWPELKMKVYIGKEVKKSAGGAMYVKPGKEIPVKIIPRLVDYKIRTMRSGNGNNMREIFGTFRD